MKNARRAANWLEIRPLAASVSSNLCLKELADRCRAAGVTVEWGDLLRDLDRLQEATIEKDGKRITTRTAVTGQVGRIFQAAGVALTPNMREHAA